jgi:aspartyl/asparaginyl-tRNA synthetase
MENSSSSKCKTIEDKLIINSHKFSYVVNKLRSFFLNKKFVEVHTQNRLSILAACEDPSTITVFNFADNKYPLPQTGQMWLEYELLSDPSVNGYFCVSTSYRNEPNPIEGRHDLIFPMFEFEMKGDMNDLQRLECDLLEYLGYTDTFTEGDYVEVAEEFKTREIEHEHEQQIYENGHSVFFLKNFPEYTNPFFNMRRNLQTNTANKIDVIMSGMETIGSAERSIDVEDMVERFKTICDGQYAAALYEHFGQERVDAELNRFLQLKFIIRSGGGIGITRLIRSMEKEHILFL